MSTAIASLIHERSGQPTLGELPIPELRDGALLVRVTAATLCGTDLRFWNDGVPAYPYIPGHESCGIVEDMSSERKDVQGQDIHVGDRILWAYPFCGQCFYCKEARQPTLCPNAIRFGRAPATLDPHLLGGCASHHYVPALSQLIRVPDAISDALAASAACALRTVVHGYQLLGSGHRGESLLVMGCGPVGLYATAMAEWYGYSRVSVLGSNEYRLDLARKFGATDAIDRNTLTEHERQTWGRSISGGEGFDVVMQCATSDALPEAMELCREGGQLISIGSGTEHPITVGSRSIGSKMLTIRGVRSGHAIHYLEALNWLAQTAIDLTPMVARTYGLAETNAALRALQDRTATKPVILPELS